MSHFRWIRFAAALCVAVWMIAPSIFAQPAPARPTQPESPLASPLASPFFSPLPPPAPDPAECGFGIPCATDAPTPEPGNQIFVPSVSGTGDAVDQPPGPPPDLGTVLNFVAAGVVVVGVLLKIYWYISDRRKRSEH